MKKIHLYVLIAIVFVLFVLYELAYFDCPVESPTETGFSKIKPYTFEKSFFMRCGGGKANYPQKVSSDGKVELTFKNSIGIDIDLIAENISVAFDVTGNNYQKCSQVTIDKVKVSDGEKFHIYGDGCPKGNIGSVYSAFIRIPYIVKMGGIESEHTESGVIRGPYE
jgi:hypothetical protein